MRSDTQLINGLTAYKLGTAQSASGLSVSTTAKSQSVNATLRPTSDISVGFPENYPHIPPPDPNPHYVDVDDVVADDLASFVVTGDSTSYVYDRYGKATYSLPAGSKIGLVRITARGYTEYPALITHQAVFAFGVYIGTTYYGSADQKTNNAWATRTYDLIRNPATGLAWTQDNINNMQIALRAKSYNDAGYGYQYAYVTQVYVEIYVYADDTVYYSVDVVKRDSAGTETAIGTKVAGWSGLISALYDSAGLKSATWACPETALASTDSIIVKAYQKVGAGSWSFVRNFTTEQLGASKLDAATWTVYYYLDVSADATYVYTVFWHGTSAYSSRIENFTWTAAVSKAWHDVSSWTASLATRTWSSGTPFSFNLPTRTWQTTNSWIFNLATLGWHDTANWMFQLQTRVWNIIGTLGDEAIAANYTDRDSGYAIWKLFQQGDGCSALGETFQVPSDGNYKLTKAGFCLRRTGSPTGYAHVVLYLMTGTFGVDGMPTGSALATSDDFDVSTLTTSYTWYNFTFSSTQEYVMQAEEFYCIVYQNPSSGFFDSTNFVLVGMNETPTYEGNRNGYIDDWYGDNVFDTSFYVYGLPTLPYSKIFYLGTSIWNYIVTYPFNLPTRAWNDLTWLFTLLPSLPEWVNVAVWIFSLTSPEWMLIALWNLQLEAAGVIAFLFIAILLLVVIVAGIIVIAYRRPKR